MPYIPVCVYDKPPPLVLIGSDPPGVDFPFSKNATPSPGFAKPIRIKGADVEFPAANQEIFLITFPTGLPKG